MGDLHTMPKDLSNKGCRRCSTTITAGDKFSRGAYGYEYLCESCAGDLGVFG